MSPRYLFLLGILWLGWLSLSAQRTCGYDAIVDDLHQHEPGFEDRHAAWHAHMRRISQMPPSTQRSTGDVYTVPVVVHVVYNTPTENITDAQIQSQIDILNEDFRRLNVDTINTPAPFQGIAADVEIEFCLATNDPDGNPTTGITRTQTTNSSWPGDHSVKYDAQGGHDGWPREQYLNMWVCNLGGGLLGYATPPTVADITRDGVVIGYNYFGNIGPLDPSFDLGRTATHEIGHWLGLAHTWGAGGCSNDDNIGDTPIQDSPNFGCPTYPSESCSNGPLGGDMFMNYMDYSDDACFNLFTQDQKAVMRALFDPGMVRHPILSSPACVNPAFHNVALDVPASLPDTICGTTYIAQALLRNAGENTLSSAEVVREYDGIIIDTLPWTGSVSPGSIGILSFPPLPVTPGLHTIRFYSIGIVNGFEDPDLTNDTTSFSFFVRNNQGFPAPFTAGFENGFPLAGWQLSNPDSAITWEWTDTASWSGDYSVMIRGFDYNDLGQIDEFTLPQVNLAGIANPTMSFYRAYARFVANSGFDDGLEIWISTDCGDSYEQIWTKYGDALTTTDPAPFPFVPTSASQWKAENIDLSAYAGSSGIYVRFRFVNDYENNLFLDAINIGDSADVTVSIPRQVQRSWRVSPNPSQGQLTLQTGQPVPGPVQATLYDAAGRVRLQTSWHQPQDRLQWDVQNLASGLYLLHIQDGAGQWTEKVLLQTQ